MNTIHFSSIPPDFVASMAALRDISQEAAYDGRADAWARGHLSSWREVDQLVYHANIQSSDVVERIDLDENREKRYFF